MGKPTLRQQIRDLIDTVASKELDLAAERLARATDRQGFDLQVGDLKREIFHEQAMRVAAQRGLVPYVRSLAILNEWLADPDRAALCGDLEPILRQLGLWGIRADHYDPDKDLRLSAISPSRA